MEGGGAVWAVLPHHHPTVFFTLFMFKWSIKISTCTLFSLLMIEFIQRSGGTVWAGPYDPEPDDDGVRADPAHHDRVLPHYLLQQQAVVRPHHHHQPDGSNFTIIEWYLWGIDKNGRFANHKSSIWVSSANVALCGFAICGPNLFVIFRLCKSANTVAILPL